MPAQRTTGNWGMLDMQSGLRWLQREVAAFGGDPDRVTIHGQCTCVRLHPYCTHHGPPSNGPPTTLPRPAHDPPTALAQPSHNPATCGALTWQRRAGMRSNCIT